MWFLYLITVPHTAQMCHVLCKNKARFFSHYCCTISVLTLCTITQLFPIIRCGNIAFVFSKDPDGELSQHYIELGSEGRFHPSSNRLSELCSIIFIFVKDYWILSQRKQITALNEAKLFFHIYSQQALVTG